MTTTYRIVRIDGASHDSTSLDTAKNLAQHFYDDCRLGSEIWKIEGDDHRLVTWVPFYCEEA